MSQRLEAQYPQYSASSSSKQNSMSYQDKTILIHKNIANRFEFYDGKRKWYRVKEDFCTLYNKYHFIKANNEETIMEAYKRINDESEAIAKKTNGRIDIRKSENYILITIKFFKETTLAPQKKRYEGEANQYDSKFPYGIYKVTIEGNSLKKSLQCTRYLRYNLHRIYTYYDLECAKENGLKVYLMNESPNTLIYEKKTYINGSNMFGKWGNILYNIKKEGEIARKNRQNYGAHPRIKPFLLASAQKIISEIIKPLEDQVKRIHKDSFIVARKVELKTGIEIGDLKFEKREI
ncbi:7890_t:CDS:2, partial [Scutellospora calospora]